MINHTIVGYVRYARFSQMQALASLFACAQLRRGSDAKQRVRQHAEYRGGIKKDLCFHKSLVYHKGFVADRRNSEVNEFTRINGALARRGSVAKQRVR